MLPVPGGRRPRRRARPRARLRRRVWFGAAAPLALLGAGAAPARRGRAASLASTHGHEVGWSMLPVGPSGAAPDRPRHRRASPPCPATPGTRLAAAFGPAPRWSTCRPASTPTMFRPDPAARAELRRRYRLGDAPVVTCVSRLVAPQGPGRADPGVAGDLRRGCRARVLLLVGDGPDAGRLRAAGRGARRRRAGRVRRAGAGRELAGPPRGRRRVRAALPHPRRRAGRRGAGHRACWRRRRPACRWWSGDSGGAPETVPDGRDRARRRRPRASRRRRRRSATCSPTRTGPPGWARPVGTGCVGSGAGAARSGCSAGCSARPAARRPSPGKPATGERIRSRSRRSPSA